MYQNSPIMGSRIVEQSHTRSPLMNPRPLRQSYVGQPYLSQSIIGQPLISQSIVGQPVVQTIVHPPIYHPPIVHPPIVHPAVSLPPMVQHQPVNILPPIVQSTVPIMQSQLMQEPGFIEEHRERVVTEEFIPAPPQPMIHSQMLQQSQMMRPPWFGRTLLIRPVAAQLTHNTDFFLAKMDPFVELILGPNRYKTTIHKNGGKRPQWNETFSHPLIGGDSEMTIIVWDQDRKKADLVGEARINLGQVLAHGSSSNWYELFWRGKSAGRILINMEIV